MEETIEFIKMNNDVKNQQQPDETELDEEGNPIL